MDVLDGGSFHFFKKSKFGGINTICCIKLFVETFGAIYGQSTIKVECDNIQI
jgi:hypothetical protein